MVGKNEKRLGSTDGGVLSVLNSEFPHTSAVLGVQVGLLTPESS